MEKIGNNEYFYLQAMKVDFLTHRWEKEMYALSLIRAAEWGKKIDEQNRKYFKRNHLIDKYNV